MEALIVSVCALHNPDPNKDLDKFNQTLWEKIGQEEPDDSITEINLAGVLFPADADFQGRVFKKWVTFAEAQFSGEADFQGTQFGGEADFQGAHFGGVASFQGAHFNGVAQFGDPHFDQGAFFGRTRFDGGAYFFWPQFDGAADFRGTQFCEGATRGGARFGGATYFASAHFEGEARFSGAQFSEAAYFAGCRFRGEAIFWDAQFVKDVEFSGVVVEESLRFHTQTFLPDDGESSVNFHLLTSESARKIRFEGVDLSRVSFLHTDVGQVHFVGCTWAKVSMPLLWPFLPRPRQPRTVIYDEVALDETGEEGGRPLVAELYRQLRLNYEANRQEAEAGHFYIGQMEMRRQDTTYPWLYRWMLGAYRVLAMYGESYLRPPVFYLLFGIGFALAYLWGGFQVGQAPVKYDPGVFAWAQAGHFFQDYVRAYVQALTAGGLLGANLFGGQMGTSLETTSWWVPAVRYANMLLDTFLVGFFVIALRRHFHR